LGSQYQDLNASIAASAAAFQYKIYLLIFCWFFCLLKIKVFFLQKNSIKSCCSCSGNIKLDEEEDHLDIGDTSWGLEDTRVTGKTDSRVYEGDLSLVVFVFSIFGFGGELNLGESNKELSLVASDNAKGNGVTCTNISTTSGQSATTSIDDNISRGIWNDG